MVYSHSYKQVLPNDNDNFDRYGLEAQSSPGNKGRATVSWKRLAALSTVLTILVSLFFIARRPSFAVSPWQSKLPTGAALEYNYGEVAAKDIKALNSTFGFEKIYVLNMPNRTDKRAEMVVLSHHYGFAIEFVEGVDGVSKKPHLHHLAAGIYGTAEGHAKVWQKILTDRISTALIFEDDNDFDMRIREQMSRLQKPLETLLTLVSSEGRIPRRIASDPWHSSEWDVLWLGSQVEKAWPKAGVNETFLRPFITYQDPTTMKPMSEEKFVNEMMQHYGLQADRDAELPVGQVRILQKVQETFALNGYAVSASGAKKLLYHNAHKGDYIDHIDTVMHRMAAAHELRAISLTPGIFSQFHGPAGVGSDSDREHKITSLAGADGSSPSIVKSAKQHLKTDLMADIPKGW
ncbi:hypothetical protein CBS101457_004950 [Exobasidium rhododendri]|nr:hypothetical protein CBS101457_004950 [Exobasidium rhododendri]